MSCRMLSRAGIKDNSTKIAAHTHRSQPKTSKTKEGNFHQSHTTVVGYDVIQCSVLISGLAGAFKLTGVRDGFSDLLFSFDDLEGEAN
jgi:hypothetical protein